MKQSIFQWRRLSTPDFICAKFILPIKTHYPLIPSCFNKKTLVSALRFVPTNDREMLKGSLLRHFLILLIQFSRQ